MVWTGEEVLWERQYLHLVEFVQAQGHTRVTTQGHRKLFEWSKEQRALRKEGRLDPARVERLTRAGFDWTDPRQRERERTEMEEAYCFELLAFRKARGHFWAQAGQLRDVAVDWLRLLRSGRVTPSSRTIEVLGELGLPRTPADWEWERHFARLAEHQARTVRAPGQLGRGPGSWLNQQLELHRRGELAPEREDRLAELGLSD